MTHTHQPGLFPELEPHLPREIPLDIHFAAREQVGYTLNYTGLWMQYREQAALDGVDNLTADFADFCVFKKGLSRPAQSS